MKKLIAGNWKMNLTLEDAKGLIADTINGLFRDSALTDKCEFLVCPSFIYFPTIRHATVQYGLLKYGAQDCSEHENGAYTGDISTDMLKESGCSYVICGHSERRQFHQESNELVALKARKVHEKGMSAIICVGEDEIQREQGSHIETVIKQLQRSVPSTSNAENSVIAYEPVWAIGTGKSATSEDVMEMHGAIRKFLKENLDSGENIRILYGGSVKPDNAAEILNVDNVDGALIGGASLDAESFLEIGRKV